MICSNRPHLRDEQARRTSAYFPDQRIIILIPDANTPHGAFRNLGVLKVESPYFLMLDDDIDYNREDAFHLLKIHEATEGLLAANPRIVFTDDRGLRKAQMREAPGVAGGFCMYNTALFREIGGFNPSYRVGEDLELYERAIRRGYKWERDPNVSVLHRGSLWEYVTRRGRHVNPRGKLRRRFKVAMRKMFRRPVELCRLGLRVVVLMIVHDLFNLLGVAKSLGERKTHV